MKTILPILLLLVAFNLKAQVPPPADATTADREAELRRALRSVTETNAPSRITPPPPRVVPQLPSPKGPPKLQVPPPALTGAATSVAPTTPADPAGTAVPPVAVAKATPPPVEEPMVNASFINWTAATLEQVLGLYSDYIGRTVIRSPQLPLTTTIVLKNQTALTRTETIQLLNAVLAINQVQMINIGDKFVKALPTAQAGGGGAVIGTNDYTGIPEMGGYTTHVVQLKYLKTSEIMPVILPFATVGIAPPIAIETSQIIVLRDNAENVKRMLEMIARVDVVVQSEFISEVIPIKFAKAEDIASALNSLGGGGGGATVGQARTSQRTATSITGRPGGLGGASGYSQPGSQGMGMPGANPNGQPTPGGASFGDRLRSLVNKAQSSGDLTLFGQNKIIADTRSNSLLIFATREDMKMIKDIIDKLDVVLAQVLIETIIMDVSLKDSLAYGVSAGQTPQVKGDWTKGGIVNNPASGGSSPLGTLGQFFTGAGTNLTGGFPTGSGISYFGRYKGDFDVAVQAAESDGRVNVVQKPRIQTSHATPASLFIGSTVPYVSGTYYGYGSAGGSSSYQQMRVGIGLNVTPFINSDGLVLMQIDETIDELAGTTAIANVGDVPNTTSRTLSAEIAVRDRETIILGGFIRNSSSKTQSGVPLLMDIPFLGNLFKSVGKSKERSELIVLMRPTVLRTPELAAAHVLEERKRLPGVDRAAEDNQREEEKAIKDYNRRHPEARTPAPLSGLSPANEPLAFSADELKLFSTQPRTNTYSQ